MRSFAITGVFVALCFLDALPLFAQLDNGNITGRVVDPAGAVVAGAQVTVTQTEMNFESVTQTNEEGIYRLVNLRPGPYRVAIVATGFKKEVRENLVLRMGNTMAVDAALEVGAVSDSVEVNAAVPLLETETSSTGTVMVGDYLYRLPIYERFMKSVLFVTPGMTFSGQANPGLFTTMHINGLNNSDIGVFEDGMLGTNGDGLGVDSIENVVEDIKVMTTVLPAEYGHSAGGAITVVKKSGTNQIHGLLSEFGRTRRMTQRHSLDLYRNSQLQPGWQSLPNYFFQMPDGNLSGPVLIPKIYDGRNKTFFLIAFNYIIEKKTAPGTDTVPTPDELNGDFTFGGIGQAIYDPRTTRKDASGNWLRDAFPGNIIPKNTWSPVAATVINMHPYLPPNQAGGMATTGPTNNFGANPLQEAFYPSYTWRLDHQFTQNFKIYATNTWNRRVYPLRPGTIANDAFSNFWNVSNTFTHQNTASVGATWVITPTLVTDLRVGYYRYDVSTPSKTYNADYASLLGMAGLPKIAMPQIWPGGFTDSLNLGSPSRNLREILTFKDDTSTVRGSHALKFGYELFRYRENNWSIGNPDGSYSYTGTSGLLTNGNNMPNTGNTLANFLTGAISSASFNYQLHSSLPRVWQNSVYVQDDWKLRPNLTLNLGLRYNIETPVVDKYGLISVFDPNAPDTSQYTNYTCNGCKGNFTHPYGASPYNTQYTRFDPRVGLAWHPLQRFVIRSGFALNHTDLRTNELNTNELYSQSTSISQSPGNPTPLFYLQNVPAFAYPALRADGSVPYVGNAGGHSVNIVQQDLRDPYTMNWNFGVETQLSRDYMLTTQYVGSAEVAMLGSWNINTMPWGMIPNPNGGGGWLNLSDPANAAYRNTWLNNTQPSLWWNNWGSINYQGNDGHMYHHEGTIKLEKRYSRGINFLAFYTIAKTLANGGGSNPYMDWGLYKSRTVYDQRHYFAGTMTYEIPLGKGRKFLNRGGWVNYLIGDFDFVFDFIVNSGQPAGMTVSGANTQNYPGYMGTYGSAIMLKQPGLRDHWQDIGNAKFNQSTQNSLIDCGFDGSFQAGWGNSCATYVPSFSRGNNAAYLFDIQRLIDHRFSAAKEIPIKERLRFQFRFDFANPLHWYNWGTINTGLNIASVANSKTFGTVQVGNEMNTVQMGGQPIMNITLALKW